LINNQHGRGTPAAVVRLLRSSPLLHELMVIPREILASGIEILRRRVFGKNFRGL
jgi:hypothetical protein